MTAKPHQRNSPWTPLASEQSHPSSDRHNARRRPCSPPQFQSSRTPPSRLRTPGTTWTDRVSSRRRPTLRPTPLILKEAQTDEKSRKFLWSAKPTHRRVGPTNINTGSELPGRVGTVESQEWCTGWARQYGQALRRRWATSLPDQNQL